MAKVTFKKDKPETGLSRVGNPQQSSDIKFKKKVFGRIFAPNWSTKDNLWGVGITVKDPATPSGWRWAFFKLRHETEQAARDWISDNFERLSEKYDIHFFED